MKTSENQKSPREYKVYIHRLKTWVEVTEEQYYTYYRDIWATRKRAQAHGQCMCPKSKTWMCDGDCLACEFRAAGDNLSLDYTVEDGEGNRKSWADDLPDDAPNAQSIMEDRELLCALYEGQGDFHCGEWCRFCKAKAECRERAEANMALARYDFQTPALLDDEEIADILGKVDALTAWASDVKEYALQQAISGKDWSGWKLVEGRSNRKYTNDAVVAATVENAGFDPYERKVLGITAMQKMLGKSRFEELLAPYIEKPQGKPTLVPESDKRPAMNTAKNDFMEEF